jgi:hypothetical protein
MPLVRLTGGVICVLLALALGVTAVFAAAPKPTPITQDLRVLKRPRHTYDSLPKFADKLAGESTMTRRVATALDSGKRAYFIYVALTKDNRLCTVLVQQNGYKADCSPVPLAFDKTRRTTAVFNGLIGGVAANDVKRVVLQGGSKRKQVQLTTDNGYIFGCPAPSKCASWVKTVLGYNSAGKLISTQTVA